MFQVFIQDGKQSAIAFSFAITAKNAGDLAIMGELLTLPEDLTKLLEIH